MIGTIFAFNNDSVKCMKEQKLATKPNSVDIDLQNQVMEAALEVHKNMGLGFGSEEYGWALAYEFGLRNIPFERKKNVKLSYKGAVAGEYNVDFVIGNTLIVSISTGDHLTDMDEAKLKSILRAIKMKTGLTVNFSKDILEIRTVER